MSERETNRLVAWGRELRDAHERLRAALRVTNDSLRAGPAPATDLLLFCRGFCTALDGHHRGENGTLFPAIADEHPELRPALRTLEQDHVMIARLLDDLSEAAARSASPDELECHLDGITAIMENHFRYEERTLSVVLETLELTAVPSAALGPL